MTTYENPADEYQRLKEELLQKVSAQKVVSEASTEDSAKLIDDLQKALDTSIHELRKAVDEIASVQEYLEGECYQSKLKAVESHQEAQASLAGHNMTGVFLSSVDKVAQIKIVQVLRAQANETGVRLASLKKSLNHLEKLRFRFRSQSQLIKSQLTTPPDAVPDSIDALVDQELVELKKQISQLDDL